MWIWIEINREKSGSTTIFAYLFTVITLIHPAATSKQHSIKSIRFTYEDFEEPLLMYDNHWVGKSQLVENKNWQLNHINRIRNCEIFETLIYTATNTHRDTPENLKTFLIKFVFICSNSSFLYHTGNLYYAKKQRWKIVTDW